MFRRQVAVAALVAPLALSASCADDGTSLRIECPTAVLDVEGVCLAEADLDACLGRGFVNVNVARGYELNLVVSSGLLPRESNIPVMAEPNNLNVESVDIEIQDTSGVAVDFGANLNNPFNRPTSGRVQVNGMGVVSVDGIPRDYLEVARDQDFTARYGTLIIDVQLLAKTDGDRAVESRHWKWPVELLDDEIGMNNCRVSEDDEARSCAAGQDLDLFPYCSEI